MSELLPGRYGRPRPYGRASGGFTLIEILVVVSIISILAAVAVPNFLEAQTRSKVSRVKADARTLVVAIEAYATDWNVYPKRKLWPPPGEDGFGDVLGLGDVRTRHEDLTAFTTPIAYVSQVPPDVFEQHIQWPNNTLEYYPPEVNTWLAGFPARGEEDSSVGWVVISVGPDNHLGANGSLGYYGIATGRRVPYQSWYVDYDPTNGTTSEGNIFRFQKGVGATQAWPGWQPQLPN